MISKIADISLNQGTIYSRVALGESFLKTDLMVPDLRLMV